MFARHPDMARRWQDETGDKRLPEKKMNKSAAFEAGIRATLEKEAMGLPGSSKRVLEKAVNKLGPARPMDIIGGSSRKLRNRASAVIGRARGALSAGAPSSLGVSHVAT